MISTLDIFISHSHQDADIAKAFIDLLRYALNIPPERIRCTSVDNYRLPVGVSINDQLLLEVEKSSVLIGIITNASLESVYVSFELGARWGAKRYLVPVLVSSKDQTLLKGPLERHNPLFCDNKQQIEHFLKDMVKKLPMYSIQRNSYNFYLERLVELSQVPRTLSTIGSLRQELGGLYEVLSKVLTAPENTHLTTLMLKNADPYEMRKSLLRELDHLTHLEFIEAHPDRSISDVPEKTEFMLKDYFSLSAYGRRYLQWLVESAP